MATRKNKRKNEQVEPNKIVCANCCQPLTGSSRHDKMVKKENVQSDCIHEILLDLNKPESYRRGKESEKMDVKTALILIYKLQVVYELNLDGSENDESFSNQIVLCISCGELLQTMYIIYDQFNDLRKTDSYLYHKIGQFDELLKQLQETWTEMANSSVTELQCNDVKTTEEKEEEKDDKDEEVMIIEKVKKNIPMITIDEPTAKEDVAQPPSQQQQQRKATVVPSTCDDNTNILCSSLEQRILEEIQAITGSAKSSGISQNDYNVDHIHYENESNIEYEDETGDGDLDYDMTDNALSPNNQLNNYHHQSMELSLTTSGPSRSSHPKDYTDDSEDSDWESSTTSRTRNKKRKRRRWTARQPRVQVLDGCPLCPQLAFDTPMAKTEHYMVHHEDKKTSKYPKCRFCDKDLSTFNNLIVHLKAHAHDHRFVCSKSTCAKSFLTYQQMCQHVCISRMSLPLAPVVSVSKIPTETTRPSPDNRFKADRAVSETDTLHSPILPRTPNSLHVTVYTTCPLCPQDSLVHQSISSPSDLSQHLWTVHRNSPTDTVCRICNKTFSQTASLNLHFRAHASDLRWPCPLETCARKFLTAQNLDKHTATYHPQLLDTSSQRSSQRSSRSISRQLDKPCQSSRSTNSGSGQNLQLYNASMRGKRTELYEQCPLCPAEKSCFPTPRDLADHWLNEHSVNSTVCPLCQHVLASIQGLRKHLKSHALESCNWPCPHSSCLGMFFTKSNFKIHISSVHNGDLLNYSVNISEEEEDMPPQEQILPQAQDIIKIDLD